MSRIKMLWELIEYGYDHEELVQERWIQETEGWPVPGDSSDDGGSSEENEALREVAGQLPDDPDDQIELEMDAMFGMEEYYGY